MDHTLCHLPLAALFLFILLLLSASAFTGNFLGGWSSRTRQGRTMMPINELVPTAILGLLGLLLGFTFSMAVTRFEMRRDLILQEVNAIGTAYLRTDLLPKSEATSSHALMHSYVKARLRYLEAESDAAELQDLEQETSRLQKSLWQEAMSATKTEQGPLAALYVASLNQLFDLYTATLAAMQNHVPGVVYLAILMAAVFGLFSLGYSQGLEKRLGYLGSFMLSLLFASVILLIMDVDRPRGGQIQVNRESMRILHQQINE